jgi:hypothetical protein
MLEVLVAKQLDLCQAVSRYGCRAALLQISAVKLILPRDSLNFHEIDLRMYFKEHLPEALL